MSITIGDVQGKLSLVDDYSKGLDLYAAKLTKSAKTIEALGSRLSSVGSQMTRTITLPLAAVGTSAVAMSTKLNESLANVSALLTDVSGKELDTVVGEMKGKVQGLAKDMGKSTNDISEGLYEVISSLGRTKDTFSQLEISSKSASAGLATTQQSFNFLSAVTKTYGDTSERAFKQVADLGFQAVNLGQTTFPELASSIGSVAPLAQMTGISLEEMFAVIATQTGVTGNTSEVITQMSSAISGLIDPSDQLKDLFKQQGLASAEASIAQKGFAGTLQMIAEHAEKTGQPLADLLGRKEAIILTASLAGAQEERFAQNLASMGEAAKANGNIVEEAFKKQTEGVNKAGFAWKQFKAEVQVAMEQLGDKLIPIVMNVAERLRPLWEMTLKLLDGFGKLPPSIQTIIVSVAGLVALAGPVMMMLGGMASGVSFLLPLLAKLVSAYSLVNSSLLAVQVGYGNLVALNISQSFAAWRVSAIAFATSITGIGLAVGALLLVLNDLIVKMRDQLQKEIEAIVQDANQLGQTLAQFQKIKLGGGIVSKEELQGMSDELSGLTDQVEKARKKVEDLRRKHIPWDQGTEKFANEAKEVERNIVVWEKRRQLLIKGMQRVTEVIGEEQQATESNTQSVVSLSEEQGKALSTVEQRIAALDRQRDSQLALLAALKEGPEAYKREERAQEIANALFEERQKLLDVQLDLTPQLAARIRTLTGSIFDSTKALEKEQAVQELVNRAKQKYITYLPTKDPWGLDKLPGKDVLDNLNQSVSDQQSVLEEINAERNKEARSIRSANALLSQGLITQEQYNEYVRQFAKLWELIPQKMTISESLLLNMRDSFISMSNEMSVTLADGLVEAAFTGGEALDQMFDSVLSSLKRTIADWLSQWFRAMQQWLAKWIATQASAKAASASLQGPTQSGGNLSQLGSSASGLSGASGAAVGIMGTAAVFAAVYIGVSKWIESHKNYAAEVTFKLHKDADAVVNQVNGNTKNVRALTESVKQAGEGVNKVLRDLGGVLAGFTSEVTIGRKGRGKDTTWFVQLENGVKEWFSSYEKAMDAAIMAAIQSANISGFTTLMQEGLASIDSENLDDLVNSLKQLREISQINYSSGMASLLDSVRGLDQLWETLSRVGNGTKAVIDGFNGLAVSEARLWQSLFDSITGRKRTDAEIRSEKETELRIAQAELTVRKATIVQRILQAQIELKAAQASNALSGSAPGGNRNANGGVTGLAYAFAAAGKTIALTTALLTDTTISASEALMKALEAEIQGLSELLNALNSLKIPDIDFGSLTSRGGKGSGTDRKSLREDLRSQIKELEAAAKGPLHEAYLAHRNGIDEFIKKAKEAKLPADELARGLDLLREQFKKTALEQARAFAGIGTDFTKRVSDVAKFFDELKELDRQKTGIPDWLVQVLEGKALNKLGTELTTMLDQFSGLVDPMLAINSKADELRQNVLAFADAANWTGEQIAAAMEQIEQGIEFQKAQAVRGLMGQLFGWLKEAGLYQKEAIEFERESRLGEIDLLEAQLRFFGALTDGTKEMIERLRGFVNSPGFGGNNGSRDVVPVRVVDTSPWEQIAEAVKSAAIAWQDGIADFTKTSQDYFTDESVTILTQDQQRAYAEERFNTLLAQAKSGDVDALRNLDAARREYLNELKESDPGQGFMFVKGFQDVMRQSADLLANARSIEEKVKQKALDDAINEFIHQGQTSTQQTVDAIYESARLVSESIYKAISGVPGLASGGIVMSPRIVRVAEYVPEAIVPLDKLAGMIPYVAPRVDAYDNLDDKLNRYVSSMTSMDSKSNGDLDWKMRDQNNRLTAIENHNYKMSNALLSIQRDMSALRRDRH